MKVLYIATSFPKPEQGATIYTDLAEALSSSGNDVTVVVSEQAKNAKSTQLSMERNLQVLRVVTGNYYDVGFIEKGITTLRMPGLMKKAIIQYFSKKSFDFILFESPPVTNGALVAWAKKKFNCPAYLMLKDLFPQNAVDLGIIKKKSFMHVFFLNKEKKLYKSADLIGCMSLANLQYILRHNKWLTKERVELFPNTKKLVEFTTVSNNNSTRTRFNIPETSCLFLVGGNMGKPQYIDILIKLIIECRHDINMHFLFVGRGTERHRLEETILKHNINNAKVVENLPRDQYDQITRACDIGLITLDPRFTTPNYPSRILSYMEFAKPILAATDRSTDLPRLLEAADCGEWVWSGDATAFVNKARAMAKDANLSKRGMNGRKYAEANFSVQTSVQILESHFRKGD